ncbi:Crp/Fnr family transcriptional regulator [Dyadobacter psychrotolerans]|uniref:Crp/Fnr family transcriptional regulator n=1 Tax=Dyadobacter psychrotolerans TaxID=2541721 RepID=A0A4V2Z4H2_9BACT|nr:Crp/Fnr family transcriptional regulator [Dyadobacter psychrotolerans]TDE16658.1 Crp/Fnr family transcriptional regulator [Dyadobacter psychrotolerans]
MDSKKPLHQLLETINTPKFESLKKHFMQLVKPNLIRKGRVLVDIGQVNSTIYLIETGVIRSYYLKGSEDITSRLVAEGEIACVAESFFTQQESEEVMETLEDTMVYSITYEAYRQLCQENILIAQLIIQLLEQRLVNFSERVRLFKYLSVEQRVEYYISQPGSLFRRVPDHYIATYLGTTPATFSRCLKTVNMDKIQH